jgi:hypothetical protein
MIRLGRRWKPDLLLVQTDAGPVVVKDYAHKRPWERLWGRWQIRHECRAYRWLGDTPGVPALLGRVDAHALAVEHVSGGPLLRAGAGRHQRRGRYAALSTLVARLEARGFVHLDLRARRNLLLDADGEPSLVDLGGALWLPPGSLRHRLLRRVVAWYYRFALLKWKRLLTPEDLTPQDLRQLRRGRRLRALWVLNPLGRHHRPSRLRRPRPSPYPVPSGPYPVERPARGGAG